MEKATFSLPSYYEETKTKLTFINKMSGLVYLACNISCHYFKISLSGY